MFDVFSSTKVLEGDFRERWENCCSRQQKRQNGDKDQKALELITEFLDKFAEDFKNRGGKTSLKLSPGRPEERSFVLETEERLDKFQECLQVMVFVMRQWHGETWPSKVEVLQDLLNLQQLEDALGAARTYRRTYNPIDASTDMEVEQLGGYDKQFLKLRRNLRDLAMLIELRKPKFISS